MRHRRLVLALALACVAFAAVVAGCTSAPDESTGHPPQNMSNNTTVPHGPVAGDPGTPGAGAGS